ncbi:endonuclease domain-containing protein [Cnuibacter physcomitrellae]|uniref:endonuclease domain-containing protein n=1 Tax=Cnuibacter physcomitrellae TaxID=1619308 RepID=UPI002175CDF0|nr:endonuclease domain-containing protein [Cnuibacter physcomitrellae]MCS5496191.1 endonuclease domain-containing protein [Cnuibacter physcomitrellae]
MEPPLSPIRSVWALRAAGYRDRELWDAVAAGHLIRVRRGWYAVPDAPPSAVRAVRLGGRLTGVSALPSYGVWTPPDDERLHVCVSGDATRLRDPDSRRTPFRPRPDVVLHWRDDPPEAQPWRVPLLHALATMSDTPRDHLVAVADSIVRGRLASQADLVETSHGAPHLAGLAASLDPRCESGAESVARVRMLASGLQAEPQVQIGPHRVDFVLGGRLVIEIDGREHHASPDAFERDRRRDAELTALGYTVLRFSYRQVLYDWPSCLAAIRQALLF